MEVIEAILTRRSIRKYSWEKITDNQIEIILKAAMYAPSAMNQQPWHFIVIDDREKLNLIMEVHPYSKMLKEAGLAILVCGDERLQLSKGYWVVDCGAATQNLLLAAHGIGLGAVWLGVHPREERKSGIRKIFHLPDHIQPFSLISIGYPAEEKPVPERFKPERIHKNTW
ncbi:MAG: nitroreductase family protein [Bacteroidales bacterium]|nr:nitroreductase family protein [Bacteroidales bacterium]